MHTGDLFAVVRGDKKADAGEVLRVNREAFGRDAEADLVDALARNGKEAVSLVAEVDGRVVGHILFTRVCIECPNRCLQAVGLAPVSVLPEVQGRGVGSMLVRAGLHRCRSEGYGAAVVLGHPAYYPRFGFVPASRFGLRWEQDGPKDAFMAMELRAGYLKGWDGGVVRYQPEFAAVSA